MNRIKIAQLYADADAFAGKTVTVAGWVKSVRDMKNFGFVTLPTHPLNPINPDNARILRITAAAGTELADAFSSGTLETPLVAFFAP